MYTGRSLLTKVYFPYVEQRNFYQTVEVNYSIYLSYILDKASITHYNLYAISKKDQSETLIDSDWVVNDYADNNMQTINFNYVEPLDFENNDYYLDISMKTEFEEILYKTKVVLSK